jgi:hypothetical protein
MRTGKFILTGSFLALLAGCASTPTDVKSPEYAAARQCEQGLDKAYEELNFSRANGVSGSWEYTKAASLLSAANIQSGLGGYAGCIEKVKTARVYINQSKQQ